MDRKHRNTVYNDSDHSAEFKLPASLANTAQRYKQNPRGGRYSILQYMQLGKASIFLKHYFAMAGLESREYGRRLCRADHATLSICKNWH
jgi:hypothetical protein